MEEQRKKENMVAVGYPASSSRCKMPCDDPWDRIDELVDEDSPLRRLRNLVLQTRAGDAVDYGDDGDDGGEVQRLQRQVGKRLKKSIRDAIKKENYVRGHNGDFQETRTKTMVRPENTGHGCK